MGLPKAITLYLDDLDDAARDRVIVATEWQPGGLGDAGGPRCLVGHAEGGVRDGAALNAAVDFDHVAWSARDFGEFVAEIKAYAAHRNALPVAARTLEPEPVA